MQLYSDKRKSVHMKLFGDIYVSSGFAAPPLPTDNYPFAESAVYFN